MKARDIDTDYIKGLVVEALIEILNGRYIISVQGDRNSIIDRVQFPETAAQIERNGCTIPLQEYLARGVHEIIKNRFL